jgi:tetratricopeptide (TPR) repeat protein
MASDGGGPVAAFCAELRKRWQASGRDLPGVAREIRISRTQLYAILNGEIRRPPDYDALVRPLIEACGGTPAELADWRRRHEVLVAVHAETQRPPTVRAPAPVLLPADVASFTGRTAELAALEAATAPVVIVSGAPGAGKTALVVHWAHRSARAFPDGRLYVNLRGFGAQEPVDPADAIRLLLDALGVEPQAVPPGIERQAALFRSRTAGRRLLVILDNARDAEQVAPLLAGDPAVRTVITSRNRLAEVVTAVGAEPLTVGLPDDAEAADLLRRRAALGPGTDEQAVRAIVAACDRLPLALSLVAGRLRLTGFAPATAVAELRRPDPAVLDSLRTVFAWSYRALSPAAARLFRLLGTAGGGDIGTAAVAALAGMPRPDTGRLLGELTGASLLDEPTPGRYELHELLRAYAREQAGPDDERRVALTRLLDHYTHTAYQAELVLNPARAPIPLPLGAAPDGVEPKQVLDGKAAREWLGTERAVLLSALRQAADEGLDRHAWQLGWALDTFLHEQQRWQDEGAAWAVALRAATALVDDAAVAHAHRFVAVAEARLERFADAHEQMRRSLEVSEAAGDRAGEAETHFVLSYLCWLQGDHDGALDHVQRSRTLWTGLGHPAWAGKSGNAVGWYHAQLGDLGAAVTSYRTALRELQQAGDRANETVVRDNLGQAYAATGDLGAAAIELDLALRLARADGDPSMAAWVTVHRGDLAETAGDRAAARELWAQAYASLAEMHHPYAADVAGKLTIHQEQESLPRRDL